MFIIIVIYIIEKKKKIKSKKCNFLRTANQDVGARLDIKASGFWGSRFEPTFFDVRIFNPYAPSNRCNPYTGQHETSKRRQYEERVREVEHGNFSPLVFSTSGGMGASTTVAYKRLAFLLSCKWKSPYCRVMSWLRCRLQVGFSLLHSAIMCIRGSRSSSGHLFNGHFPASVDLALGEGRLGAVSFFLFLFYSVFCRFCFSSSVGVGIG